VMLHRSVCDTVSMDFCARAAWALAWAAARLWHFRQFDM